MCNLAAYVGDRPAAPILLDMIEREEGFGGGYYTGLATLAGGELHYAKVVGDTATLRRETDAEKLPGTIGIVHSRSKSGGGREWGHPFVDCAERMAYVANGSIGVFNNKKQRDGVAQRLAAAGHTFRSREPQPVGNYPMLADGASTHMSEVMCHLIESFVADGADPADAMRRAYCEYPSEIVGLMVHADHPERVIASRINQPLMIGRTRTATFMATTAIAFPPSESFEWLTAMPTNATASIRRNAIDVLPFNPPPKPVADLCPWADGQAAVLDVLADGQAHGFGQMDKATLPFWPDSQIPQKAMMVYEILRALHAQGKVAFETVEVDGVLEGATAPSTRTRLVAD